MNFIPSTPVVGISASVCCCISRSVNTLARASVAFVPPAWASSSEPLKSTCSSSLSASCSTGLPLTARSRARRSSCAICACRLISCRESVPPKRFAALAHRLLARACRVERKLASFFSASRRSSAASSGFSSSRRSRSFCCSLRSARLWILRKARDLILDNRLLRVASCNISCFNFRTWLSCCTRAMLSTAGKALAPLTWSPVKPASSMACCNSVSKSFSGSNDSTRSPVFIVTSPTGPRTT
mmetsp:Transcript_72820/g.194374  ORF Transcript_72820/g.194374 Transcript_72820/m.194374 type:complete len:242 (+) Transcript_72820:469-1194(+)